MMFSTRLGPNGPIPVPIDSSSGQASLKQREELLACIGKAMTDADETLADLFQMVAALADKLVGGTPVPAENQEGYPPPPGALNGMLWSVEVHGRHLSVLRARLSALLQVL